MSKHFIQTAIKHVGALHKVLGIPQGNDIPPAVLERHAKGNTVMAHRAQLAMTLNHLHKNDVATAPKKKFDGYVDAALKRSK